jgi:hypothetical protein
MKALDSQTHLLTKLVRIFYIYYFIDDLPSGSTLDGRIDAGNHYFSPRRSRSSQSWYYICFVEGQRLFRVGILDNTFDGSVDGA